MDNLETCIVEIKKAIVRIEDQMTETVEAVKEVNRKYGRPRMLSFIAADPRRKNVADIVIGALKGNIFKGVKIYPIMGFAPDDKRLYSIYEYCMRNEVPVTTHCENGGIPGFDDYYHLAHPGHWKTVLEDFPEMKLNLAHNDRTCLRAVTHRQAGSSWQPVIAELIIKCPNVYTDVSYDTEMLYMPGRYFKSIKRMLNTRKILERVLYGTDWYMGRCFWTEKSYLKWFTMYSRRIPWCRVEFTPEEIKRMTEDNPTSFLGLRKTISTQ